MDRTRVSRRAGPATGAASRAGGQALRTPPPAAPAAPAGADPPRAATGPALRGRRRECETLSALVAAAEAGKVVRWAPDVQLTFCVLRQTFPSQERYETVVANMTGAAQDWMDTCGVTFRYVPELDGSESTRPEGVVFPVRGIDAGGAFIASAFFPTDAAPRRRVLIDPSYFTTSFDRTGVLRHELGHTLGFRHEHIRSDARRSARTSRRPASSSSPTTTRSR